MTTTIEIVVVAAIAGFVVGFLLSKLKGSRKKSSENHPQKKSAPIQKIQSLPADVKERVQALVDRGHKIGAIKELRDATGLGLEEAKDVIDSMATSLPTSNNLDAIAQVRDLIRSGKKTEALDLYRESSGMSLKEAEEAIDKMEKEFGAPKS